MADLGQSDPSQLTIREIELLRALLDVRLDAMRATSDEKLRAVDLQFALVERQRQEQKADTKAAVDAALAAQKDAVRDQTIASERAIQKSEITFATALGAVNTAVGDLKDRVAKIEAIRLGSRETSSVVFIIAGLVIAALGVYLGSR